MKVFNFPTGEVHVRLDGPESQVFIPILTQTSKFNLNDWLMSVLLACETNSQLMPASGFSLLLPYLPYSRQDRSTTEGDAFSLKFIGKTLNSIQGLRRVITYDVHSDVAFGVINNLVNLNYSNLWLNPKLRDLTSIDLNMKEKVLVIPDQGAVKKLLSYQDKFDATVIGIKTRNPDNGRVSVEGIYGDSLVIGKDCLIIDDICDGGGTFIQLAKLLYEHGAKSVDLMVTHGIFTKGVDVLFDAGIKNILTTDSFEQIPHPNLHFLSTPTIMTGYTNRYMAQMGVGFAI